MIMKSCLAAMLTTGVALTGSTAIAQEAAVAATVQIDEFSCRDLLILSGEERDFVLVFMHGFMSGKLREMTFDTMQLAEATDTVVTTCIDNPDDTLLSAFEAARGQG